MNTVNQLIEQFEAKKHDDRLKELYIDPERIGSERERYRQALLKFKSLYGNKEVQVFSAAGRTEVSGNHTDHQHGRVLAASIDLDTIAIVSKREDPIIEIVSDAFEIDPVDTQNTEFVQAIEDSTSLIKGVVQGFKNSGYKVGGFDAYMTSEVLVGAGLSSSASFEVLVGTILSFLYNEGAVPMVEIAKIAQYAENVYFGKPCGLMDQCACAVGGMITIDFKDPKDPIVKRVETDFANDHLSLCIVDTKGSHAELTEEYAAIPKEMKKVARYFDQEVLRDVDRDAFYRALPQIREQVGDRAILRAIHFFDENERVEQIVHALETGNKPAFLKGIKASGDSSFKYLQNVYPSSFPQAQAISIALAMSEKILKDAGVARVHGGGFAGTIQAFVDRDAIEQYKEQIETIFGKGSCHILQIRPEGGTLVIQ